MNLNPDKDQLLFLPIGGSQEIGMNANLYCYRGTWILVDCGIMFRKNTVTGDSDVYVPNLYQVAEIVNKLSAIFITHGHDDHIGALQHFLYSKSKVNLSNVKVYSTQFTCELIRARFGACRKMNFIPIQYNQEVRVGEIDVKFINVTHSIPYNASLFIKTPVGNVFHSGDWKFDSSPVIGQPSDIAALEQCGKDGVMAVIGDSTNAHEMEEPTSEADISQVDGMIAQCKKRIFVTCFSSNVSRILTFMRLAKKHGRTPLLLGYSMNNVVETAKKCDIDIDVDYYDCAGHFYLYNPEDVMVICTGSQGERNSALHRLSLQILDDIATIGKGDTVLFSSRVIPGNEDSVYDICNRLFSIGANIITSDSCPSLHVGGHPDKNNIKQMYSYLQPDTLIPVHGEFRQIMEHRRFADTMGIKKVLIPRNGNVIDIVKAKVIDQIDTPGLIVDGKQLLPKEHPVLRERADLMYGGIVVILANVNNAGKLVKPIEIQSYGLLNAQKVINKIRLQAAKYASKKQIQHKSFVKVIGGIVSDAASSFGVKRPKVQVLVNSI